MQFSQANQRRRRVLADDLSAGDDAANRAAVPPPSRSHRRIDGYAPAAKPEHQRRVVDLLPGSYLSAGFWIAGGFAVVGLLAAGQIWLPAIAARIPVKAAAALELGTPGSLESWVASLWLGLAGAVSLLIYAIRRHKLDDYRGRYRWWLVGAVAWLVMSVDASCGIHSLFASIMVHLTGYVGPGGGAAWWIGFWGMLLAGLSARLAWEMRVCRPAMWAYLSAIAFWACGIGLDLAEIRLKGPSRLPPGEIAKLLGHLSLLLGLSVYARHVILHAQGLLPSRKRRSGKGKSAAASPAKTKTDLKPHVAFRPAAGEVVEDSTATRSVSPNRPALQPLAPPDEIEQDEEPSDDTDADDNSGDNRKLSKAERKRLRKLKAREEQGW